MFNTHIRLTQFGSGFWFRLRALVPGFIPSRHAYYTNRPVSRNQISSPGVLREIRSFSVMSVILETSVGDITIDLFTDERPISNFIFQIFKTAVYIVLHRHPRSRIIISYTPIVDMSVLLSSYSFASANCLLLTSPPISTDYLSTANLSTADLPTN